VLHWFFLSGWAVMPASRYLIKVARPGAGWHQRNRQPIASLDRRSPPSRPRPAVADP